ncbi:hypothetical protein Fmac_020370 [Flemingia macrophylla]|uniref:Uncharacterized protein n=1 Tax=Flemingia macrophylla TaxID=520843 RepID=A0ABD1LUG9_9FABA
MCLSPPFVFPLFPLRLPLLPLSLPTLVLSWVARFVAKELIFGKNFSLLEGLCACLVWVLDGSEPDEVARLAVDDLVGLNVFGGGSGPSRVNTWHNVLVTMQKRTKQLVAQREGNVSFEPFPSLVVTANGVSQGDQHKQKNANKPPFINGQAGSVIVEAKDNRNRKNWS